jgi:hypothetical protein
LCDNKITSQTIQIQKIITTGAGAYTIKSKLEEYLDLIKWLTNHDFQNFQVFIFAGILKRFYNEEDTTDIFIITDSDQLNSIAQNKIQDLFKNPEQYIKDSSVFDGSVTDAVAKGFNLFDYSFFTNKIVVDLNLIFSELPELKLLNYINQFCYTRS